jgi:3(or 17)beta-hydroxysteroid dehydrogenase
MEDAMQGRGSGRVAGKVALVTGGASGIGGASARLLAREGARVVIADLQDGLGEALRDELAQAGADAVYAHLDVTDEDAWERTVAGVMQRFGRLDVAVNCAGIGARAQLFPTEVSLEDWRAVMRVNLDGVFLGTKHSLKAMRASEPVNGSIINISSILGIVGSPGIDPYPASKGGVRLYTKSVALACAQERVNVRVNSVHPGYIETPLLQAALRRQNDVDEARRRYNALAPVGHLGQPEDIGYGVLYLASDESKYVTGAELVIDGGVTAR